MPLSLLDMPAVRAAVSDLHRILEDPTPTNEVARRAFRWSTGRSTLGEQDPTGKTASALVGAGVEWVMFHFGDHTRDQCPEITDSQLDLKTKAALLELRGELLSPFASHSLATDAGVRVRFLMFLAGVLARIASPAAGGVTPAEAAPTGAGDFIERLLAGPADAELTPRDMALLEAHLKQPISLSAIQREKAGTGTCFREIAPPPPNETQQGEGGTPGNNRAKGIPLAEAEILVRDWLLKHAKDNPTGITRDAVAAGTDVSAGQVSKTAAWKAFRERRDAEAKPGAREVPLTDAMQAVVPGDCETPDELAALIEEQRADEAEENRRHKRRHKPS